MQTAFALFALALAGLLSLNMSRQRAYAEGSMAAHEVTALALAAAAAELDAAAALPYDASGDANALTPPAGFGTPGGTFAEATDLDDLHDARRTVTITTPQGVLTLEVTGTVRYVESDGAGGYSTATEPTFVKELSVTAAGEGEAVTLSRLYPFRPAA